MLVAAVVAGVVSVSVVSGNYIVPLAVAVTAAIVMYAAKKRVEGVIEDERDYQTAGNAARWTVNIYAAVSAVAAMMFMAMRGQNPGYEAFGSFLAYSACALMLMQSVLFKYFQGKSNG